MKIKRLLLLVLIFISQQVLAQLDSTVRDLTTLSLEQLLNVKIVTASKNQMAAGQAPATVMVITEEQIQLRGYRSLLDVLMDIPDFKIDDNSNSTSRNTITVRGIDGQQKFIVMLNGVRISSPANELVPVMENYPVNLAKQIEIIYGPASALYGADALSGIINIISKEAEFVSSKSEVSYAMGDHGLYNGSLFASRKILKDAVVTISGQYFYDAGVNLSERFKKDTLWNTSSLRSGTFNSIYGPMTPREPVSSQYGAPLKAYNIYANLRFGEFDFSFFKNYSQNSSAIENNPNNAVYNKDVFYGRGVNVFNARHTKKLDNISLFTTLTASEYKINPETSYRNLYTSMERAYKYGYSSMIRAEEQLEWKIKPGSTFIGGMVYESFYALPESADLQDPVRDNAAIEGVLLGTKSYYRPKGIGAKIYSVKYNNIGGFAQLQQKVGDHIDLTLGTRLDHNTRFGSTFNPRLGMVWNPTRSLTVKLLAGTAYLAPTPTSGYSYYGTFVTLDSGKTYRSNFFHLPNPNLKPIKSRNLETSVRKYWGKHFSATVSGYYTSISNLIDYASDDGNTNIYGGKFLGWDVDYIEVFVNRGHQRVYGGSFQADYNRTFRGGMINAYAYVSLVDGIEELLQTDQNGIQQHFHVEIDRISQYMVKTGADIALKGWSFSPRLVWISDQRLPGFVDDEAPGKRQTIKGYKLLNIALGYKLGKVNLFANLTNALNQEYRSVGPNMDLNNGNTELFYGNYQNPRRLNAGVKVTF